MPRLARCFAALLFWSISVLAQQQPVPKPPLVKPQLFGGTVTSLTDRQITVTRTSVGHSPEHRTFLIDEKTKMNKAALQLRSKVTVRYRHMPEGNIALEIQLQPRSSRRAKST